MGAGGGILRRHAKYSVPAFNYRAWHITKRLGPLQADFCGLARRHALDQELGADEGHGADLVGDVDKKIGMISAFAVHCSFHRIDLPGHSYLLILAGLDRKPGKNSNEREADRK
jgi:hypothetical protein